MKMTFDCIHYKDGYKFQLDTMLVTDTAIKGHTVVDPYYILDCHGRLTIFRGYAWDGATGFPDIKSIVRGSCVHDCGYQMIRRKQLPDKYRDDFDALLRRMCIRDGMSKWMASCVHFAVRKFADDAAKPSAERQVLIAP